MLFKFKELYKQILLRQQLLQLLALMDQQFRLVVVVVLAVLLVLMDNHNENFAVLLVHVQIVVMVKVVIVIRKRNSIYVTFLDVIKYMGKHHIYVPIYDGIQVKDHLFVIGYSVENVSLGQMSFNDIVERIQVN